MHRSTGRPEQQQLSLPLLPRQAPPSYSRSTPASLLKTPTPFVQPTTVTISTHFLAALQIDDQFHHYATRARRETNPVVQPTLPPRESIMSVSSQSYSPTPHVPPHLIVNSHSHT